MAGAWSELVDNARDLGIPLPPNGTRPEQARAIDPKLVPLAQATDAQVFGPVQPDRSVAREHWTQSDSAAKTLRQKTRRRTRIRAAWSTRSLREQARPVLATRKADLARLAAQARRVARITRARTAQLTARGEQS